MNRETSIYVLASINSSESKLSMQWMLQRCMRYDQVYGEARSIMYRVLAGAFSLRCSPLQYQYEVCSMKIFGVKSDALKYAEDDFETYLSLNVKMLSAMSVFVGLNGRKDFSKYGILAKIPILTIFTVIFAVTSGFCQTLWIFRILSTDMKTATLISTNVFSNISCVSKGVRLSTTKKDLQLLLDNVSTMWNNNRPNEKCYKNVIKRAKNTLKFVKGYMYMTIGLIVNIGVPPIQSMLFQYLSNRPSNYTYDYSVRCFIIQYPFAIESASVYYPLICEEFWILFGLCLCWVSCDTLFASLTTHLSIQFEILENDINSLINCETDEKCLKKNIFIFVNRHREILRACKEVERIFSPVIFVNVVVSSMNICVNTFMLQETAAERAYADAGYHFFLIFNTFLQIIVYCVFAETLTQKSLSISNAIYDSEWSDKSQEFKVCIQILLMKTQNPFYCSAYGFFTLTHEQFTKIVNTSMSYYMMLRTTSQ